MKTSDIPAPVWYMGGLAVAGIVAYFLIKKGAGAAANAVNPLNPNNAINTGFNSTLESLGVIDKGSSLGSQIYDWLHPQDPAMFTTPFKPKTPYDYGQGGDAGIPYRDGVNTLPDPFNYSLGYIAGPTTSSDPKFNFPSS